MIYGQPVRVTGLYPAVKRARALKREQELKQCTRAAKEARIKGDVAAWRPAVGLSGRSSPDCSRMPRDPGVVIVRPFLRTPFRAAPVVVDTIVA
jgi:hypothetical protein